ncbi:hypothetical protein HPCPY6311_1130 [Helicobacter pylori CPY6311]|nr:hypothetical protein HPCPY6311_1130 [Helicobacter pylori CPY6311]
MFNAVIKLFNDFKRVVGEVGFCALNSNCLLNSLMLWLLSNALLM